MITAAVIAAYVLVGVVAGLLILRHFGWANAARSSSGTFYVKDNDISGAAMAGVFWPAAIAIGVLILLHQSADRGLINKVAEGRKPPRRFREQVAVAQGKRLTSGKNRWT